jgi:2-polyprenyl-3-methyl-5-hydroxy-6-metoxy-1,4-benzoquinol methylase
MSADQQLPSVKRHDPTVRFAFGNNWQRYLQTIQPADIQRAQASLSPAIDHIDRPRATFLDVGCGSGLFSRAAYQAGFGQITSFDYDPQSVAAATELRARASGDTTRWSIGQGSILDPQYLQSLGQFDVVYAWGVCHHTGHMWDAVNNAMARVRPGGVIYLALYNDQGWISKYWTGVKRLYSAVPRAGKVAMDSMYVAFFAAALAAADVVRARNPLGRYRDDGRAMRFTTDIIDWIGGYPFEVATAAETIGFARDRGFDATWTNLVGRKHGCNEFVFRRSRD